MKSIDLVSVNVGAIETLGYRHGEPVPSGYRKRPVGASGVQVAVNGIEGDAQADLIAHGGPDKAIYAYSADHFPFWTETLTAAEPFGPGSFAENLTLANVDETAVCIGDVWQWGTALLQPCQPRFPCFKMAMATERPIIVKRFLSEARSGIYLRVLKPGAADLTKPITVVEQDLQRLTIRETAEALYRGDDPVRQRAIAAHPLLAFSWRAMLLDTARHFEEIASPSQ